MDTFAAANEIDEILKTVRLMLGANGIMYVRFRRGKRLIQVPLVSREFKDWIVQQYRDATMGMPNLALLKAKIAEKECEVRDLGVTHPVAARVHASNGSIWVNMSDKNGFVACIDSTGYIMEEEEETDIIFRTRAVSG